MGHGEAGRRPRNGGPLGTQPGLNWGPLPAPRPVLPHLKPSELPGAAGRQAALPAATGPAVCPAARRRLWARWLLGPPPRGNHREPSAPTTACRAGGDRRGLVATPPAPGHQPPAAPSAGQAHTCLGAWAPGTPFLRRSLPPRPAQTLTSAEASRPYLLLYPSQHTCPRLSSVTGCVAHQDASAPGPRADLRTLPAPREDVGDKRSVSARTAWYSFLDNNKAKCCLNKKKEPSAVFTLVILSIKLTLKCYPFLLQKNNFGS